LLSLALPPFSKIIRIICFFSFPVNTAEARAEIAVGQCVYISTVFVPEVESGPGLTSTSHSGIRSIYALSKVA